MKRISQLDGVRGIAILLVIVWHYFNCQITPERKSLLYYVGKTSSLTWSGVDLFFVLSGFLIAGILLDHRDAPNFFRVFYLRRVVRIFPLYFLLLALFSVLRAVPGFASPSFDWLFRDPLPMWSYASFTQNFLMGMLGDFGPNWLGITWSLAVEEQFYLVVPVLVYLLPRRALVLFLVFAILAAPVLRTLSPGFHAFVNTPWRSDSLLSGALLAVLVRWQPFLSAVVQRRRWLLSCFGILLFGAIVMTFRPTTFRAFNHLWLACLYAALVLIAFVGTEPAFGKVLASRWLVWFGQLSYGIYMFHQAVLGMFHGFFRQGAPHIENAFDAGITLAALGVTLALAAISHRFFESPLLRFGHRFEYRSNPPPEKTLQVLPNDA